MKRKRASDDSWQTSGEPHFIAYRAGRRARDANEAESVCPYSSQDLARRCGWLGGYRDRANEMKSWV